MGVVAVGGAIAECYGLKMFAGSNKGFLTLGADNGKAFGIGGVNTVEFKKLVYTLAGAVKEVADFLKGHVIGNVEFFKHVFCNAGGVGAGFKGYGFVLHALQSLIPLLTVFFHKFSLNKVFSHILYKQIEYVKSSSIKP
jgi:hypothetical protein